MIFLIVLLLVQSFVAFASNQSGAHQTMRPFYIGAFSCTLHENLAVTPRENVSIAQAFDLIKYTAAVKASALKQIKNAQRTEKNECGCKSHPKLFLYTPDGAVVMIDEPGTSYATFSFQKKHFKK